MRAMGRIAAAVAMVVTLLALGSAAGAADPPVTLVGDLQSELGCPSDWAPDCSTTYMTNAGGVYRFTAALPAGSSPTQTRTASR